MNLTMQIAVHYLGAECQVRVFEDFNPNTGSSALANIVSIRYRADLNNGEREKIKRIAIKKWSAYWKSPEGIAKMQESTS